jgi:anti-sigma factor RsiW
MIDRDSPVTQDELHAYVDGEIPADRRAAVEAWLATHPDDAARVADWRAQAEVIRGHFGGLATEAVPERFNLDRLARTGRPWRAVAAAAVIAALIGGVAGWMARGASAAAAPTGFDVYTSEALDAHKLYTVEVRHPVEVPGTERDHLVTWLSKRVGYELRAPDLEPIGLTLVGGRLLPGPVGANGAAGFFMYEAATGERFTIYCAQSGSPETGMRYREVDHFSSFYWTDHGLAYVMSGPSDRKRLWGVVKAAYDQFDRGSPGTREGPAKPGGSGKMGVSGKTGG